MSQWPPQLPPQKYPMSTPAIPLEIPSYIGSGRPGILSAVGVFSIILGSLGILANIVFLLMAMFMSNFAGRNHPVRATSIATVSLPNLPAPEYVSHDGIASAQRTIILDGLSMRSPLTPARREHLDALLADAGKKLFNNPPSSLTPEQVAARVTKANKIPSGAGGLPSDEFILSTGRLVVNDGTASFTPAGSPAPIRSQGGSITDSTGTHLATVQISAVVDRVQGLCNNAMNQTQIDALRGQLVSPSQTIIAQSNSVATAVAQVQSARLLADGTVGIATNSKQISIGPAGETAPGITPAAGYSPIGPMPNAPRGATTGMYIDAIVASGLAGFLLLIGILVMKNSARGRTTHLIYAIAKIPLAILGAYAAYVVFAAIATTGGSTTHDTTGAMVYAVIVTILGIIYPVILLVVMMMPNVREFYRTPTVGKVY